MPRHLHKATQQGTAWNEEEATSATRIALPSHHPSHAALRTREPLPALMPTPVPTTDAIPTDLGQLEDSYELYEEIARGGMASVHLGRSITPGAPRAVAIKLLHAQLAWNPSFVAMFMDEGRLAARIHHPNVVAPLDFVVRAEQGELCLVMEYVHGDTLSHLLTRAVHGGNAPTPAVAAGIMVGVLRGLQAAHEATTDDGMPLEIVHRDVSPQNIMVGTDGVARVLDFGVARAKMGDLPIGQTDRGGKPAYLAPEQIRFQKIDRRADLFSAGVVLWELLAGRRLFRHSDPRMVWVNILSSEVPPPSRYNPSVSPALDLVVLKALERDRGRRHATARDFAQAIIDTVEPAGAAEIGRWVMQVSGDILNRRARRVGEIMAGPRVTAPMRAVDDPAYVRAARHLAALWPRLFARRRWGGPGLLVAALAGMAISSGSSRALLQRSPDRPAAPVLGAPLAASTSPIPGFPPSPPAVRIDTGPRAGAPPRAPIAPAPVAPPPVVAQAVAPTPLAAAVKLPEPAGAPAEDAPPETDDDSAADPSPPPAPRSRGKASTASRDRRPAARGGRGRAVARIDALNRRAMTAYARGNYEGARLLLRAALATCFSARLESDRIAATTHVHLGVVLATGFQQPGMAVEQFRRALRIDPSVPLARRYAKPPVTAALREAVART